MDDTSSSSTSLVSVIIDIITPSSFRATNLTLNINLT